jgi:hypothetical protein
LTVDVELVRLVDELPRARRVLRAAERDRGPGAQAREEVFHGRARRHALGLGSRLRREAVAPQPVFGARRGAPTPVAQLAAQVEHGLGIVGKRRHTSDGWRLRTC